VAWEREWVNFSMRPLNMHVGNKEMRKGVINAIIHMP